MMSYVQYAISQPNHCLWFWGYQAHKYLNVSSYPSIQGVYAYPMVPNPTHYASRLSYSVSL